jgi:hypothetical protein
MLAPGEGVVNRGGMQTLGRDGLSRLNAGGGVGGSVVDMGAYREEQIALRGEVAGLRADLRSDRLRSDERVALIVKSTTRKQMSGGRR